MRLWEVVAVGISFGLLGLVLAVYVMPRARRGAGMAVLIPAAVGFAWAGVSVGVAAAFRALLSHGAIAACQSDSGSGQI